ncbi:MAG: hypothetical protein A2031_05925 [Deltaproteobacteria bacterium RBG_19FT_COMBO_43_11]|jgi:hypothetical protein|nr:MAG: hypothetical protein A2W27_07055 [Deltaproteobacteria bacterium RBG_16_44_11]OGP91120.1 MAG: hypothetical protein A2031_05925 [Deltaproteobacteria bacterium RBG_19FT_COMBO_43_11]
METLRGNISDLVNILNKLRNNSDDPLQQEKLQKILRILFMLWEEVIRQTLDSNTPAYKTALQSLSEAEKTATKAITDIKKVADAIKAAVKAAKAVDAVVGVIGPILL